jgi:hypothetical protein
VVVGGGAVLLRNYLPPMPRSIGEAARLWDQGRAWVSGRSATPAPQPVVKSASAVAAPAAKAAIAPVPAVAAATVRARGPEIVPMPALPSEAVSRPAPARAMRPHRDPLAMMPTRHRRRGFARTAAPVRAPLAAASLAAVPFKKAAAAAPDPFEDGAAPASRAAATPGDDIRPAKAEKAERAAQLENLEPAEKAAPPPPRETPRARAEVREAPAPRRAPDALDALMATAVSHPVQGRRSKSSELERKLASVDDPAPEAPRKKVEAPPPAHSLSRSEIQTVMRGVQGKVSDCYRKFQVAGAADVKINVGETGSVTAVQLSGPVAGTPSGACVERAVESAVFPASSGLRFDYRLQLR